MMRFIQIFSTKMQKLIGKHTSESSMKKFNLMDFG